MQYRRVGALLAALMLCGLCTGCNSGGQSTPADSLTVLTIGTADSGGTMYPVGSAIAEFLSDDQLKINVSASTGSLMNIESLLSGEIDLGLVSGDAADAAAGDPSQDAQSLRVIGAVYSSTSNWLAPASSGIQYVHDLAGMRIGVGPQGSTTELSAQIAVETLGLEKAGAVLENCSLEVGAEMVLDGKLDAIHGFVGFPSVGLDRLAQQVPCRVLAYTREELDQILAQNDIYFRAVIPAGTYTGQLRSVPTFGVKCLLCVDASMDDELVYALTRALWASADAMGAVHPAMADMGKDGFLWENLPLPLHDGAARFYEENCPDYVAPS